MIFLRQVDEVLCKEMADLRMIEIDHGAPFGIAVKEAVARHFPQNVVDVAGVIEDNVEE